MGDGRDHWHNALKRGVRFSHGTRCDTLEILQYPSLADPQWAEGTLDDSTLPQWLNQVRKTSYERTIRLFIQSFSIGNYPYTGQRVVKTPQRGCDCRKVQRRTIGAASTDARMKHSDLRLE